jgi:hypothetical protein
VSAALHGDPDPGDAERELGRWRTSRDRAGIEQKSSRVALLPGREWLFDPPHRGFYIVGRKL